MLCWKVQADRERNPKEINEIREIAEGKERAPGCIVFESEAWLCGMEGRGMLTEQQKTNWYVIRVLLLTEMRSLNY